MPLIRCIKTIDKYCKALSTIFSSMLEQNQGLQVPECGEQHQGSTGGGAPRRATCRDCSRSSGTAWRGTASTCSDTCPGTAAPARRSTRANHSSRWVLSKTRDQIDSEWGKACVYQKQCCGSGMFIPDPDFYPSRIPDLGSKNSNKRERWKKNLYHTFFL